MRMKHLAFQTLRALADGEYHSGEAIAHSLGVSRGAVWYGIRDILAAGLAVEKVRGRGYRLQQPVSMLSADAVRSAMGSAAETIDVELVDTTDSTNSLLMQRAAAGERRPLALATEWQQAGRGRRGRVWHSALGSSLTFSVLWPFQQGARELAGLSLAVGVALAQVCREAGAAAVQLKWPNDVVTPAGKLAGILIEMQGDVLGPSLAVIGIGLNVRADAALTQQVDQALTALETETARPVDRNLILGKALAALVDTLSRFGASGFTASRDHWQSLHAHQDQAVTLIQPDGVCIGGIARGAAEDGSLLLETPSGVQRFHSGELSLRTACP